MYAGIDAYMDAPRHCIQNARSVDEIKLDKLYMQCHVINTSAKCNETYIVTTSNMENIWHNNCKIMRHVIYRIDL